MSDSVDWSTFGNQSSYFDIGKIRVAFGLATLSNIASGSENPVTIPFGTTFASEPTVVFQVRNWIPATFQVVSSTTTSDFDALVKHYFGSTLNIPIGWIAVGLKP